MLFRFLHSENTRSDASVLIIESAVPFQLDVAIITPDELLLSVLKYSSSYIVNQEKNLIIISHSRNLAAIYNGRIFLLKNPASVICFCNASVRI